MRHRKNCIERLKSPTGEWIVHNFHLKQLAINFFANLYTDDNPSGNVYLPGLSPATISSDDDVCLSSEVTWNKFE